MKPIKRIEELKPLSRQHHEGLLMCFKIRQGLKFDINPSRIQEFIKYSYDAHLKSHFELEEAHILPILNEDSEERVRVLNEHEEIRKAVQCDNPSKESLKEFETLLNDHIRYEERIVFNKIQEKASEEELEKIEKLHIADPVYKEYEDQFWTR